MAKIKLGAPPASIEHKVTAPLPDGTEGEIVITYKYRTRKQFAELLDQTFGAGAKTAEPQNVAQATEAGLAANAEYIMAIASGWDLPEPFDLAHVEQLCDELPGVALAIMSAYRQAITEGRVGN